MSDEELIMQYRSTLEVMQDKLSALKSDHQKKIEKTSEVQKSSHEYQTLLQTIQYLQDSIKSSSQEIKKIKSQTYTSTNSSEIQSLSQELSILTQQNSTLNSKSLFSSSSMPQIEQSKPKHLALVKKMTVSEEKNQLLKDELIYLEAEKNKQRGEYYRVTSSLGLEEKHKTELKQIEKEIDQVNAGIKIYNMRLADLRNIIQDHLEKIIPTGAKDLVAKVKDLESSKKESSRQVDFLFNSLQELEKEITQEKLNPDKDPPSNIKQEIRNLELEITKKNKEIKKRTQEKNKLLNEYENKTKGLPSKKSSKKNASLNFYKGQNHAVSSNSVCLSADKRNSLVTLMDKNSAQNSGIEEYTKCSSPGIGSKIVSLNRDDFLRKLKFNK